MQHHQDDHHLQLYDIYTNNDLYSSFTQNVLQHYVHVFKLKGYIADPPDQQKNADRDPNINNKWDMMYNSYAKETALYLYCT